MSFDQQGGFGGGARGMVDVSSMGLKCAGCGASITELPFMPKSDRPVYCRDCNRNRKSDGASSAPRDRAPREMVDVSAMGLKCGECGVAITELPFMPSGDRPVFCKDCNRNRRGSSPRF